MIYYGYITDVLWLRSDQFIHEFGNADGGVFLYVVGAIAVDAEFGSVGYACSSKNNDFLSHNKLGVSVNVMIFECKDTKKIAYAQG